MLQGLIARYSTADVVIQVACGERAGEVLETIEEFATMKDPRGGLAHGPHGGHLQHVVDASGGA